MGEAKSRNLLGFTTRRVSRILAAAVGLHGAGRSAGEASGKLAVLVDVGSLDVLQPLESVSSSSGSPPRCAAVRWPQSFVTDPSREAREIGQLALAQVQLLSTGYEDRGEGTSLVRTLASRDAGPTLQRHGPS